MTCVFIKRGILDTEMDTHRENTCEHENVDQGVVFTRQKNATDCQPTARNEEKGTEQILPHSPQKDQP